MKTFPHVSILSILPTFFATLNLFQGTYLLCFSFNLLFWFETQFISWITIWNLTSYQSCSDSFVHQQQKIQQWIEPSRGIQLNWMKLFPFSASSEIYWVSLVLLVQGSLRKRQSFILHKHTKLLFSICFLHLLGEECWDFQLRWTTYTNELWNMKSNFQPPHGSAYMTLDHFSYFCVVSEREHITTFAKIEGFRDHNDKIFAIFPRLSSLITNEWVVESFYVSIFSHLLFHIEACLILFQCVSSRLRVKIIIREMRKIATRIVKSMKISFHFLLLVRQ